jgi:hypothetical protein
MLKLLTIKSYTIYYPQSHPYPRGKEGFKPKSKRRRLYPKHLIHNKVDGKEED